MIDTAMLEAEDITTVDAFKEWTRRRIRPIFPHGALCSGHGHLNAGGVALDYVVTIDYPASHIQGIHNRAGGIDTPILRRWLATREPQLFEEDHPWPDTSAEYLESFRLHGLKNTAAHAVYDSARCVGTYHSFHRIPGRLDGSHAELLKQLVPVMHEALCTVIELLQAKDDFTRRYVGLSPREKEIARWVGQGKTNHEIASLSRLSENTVKHHLTSIFDKLEVESRTQLVHRVVDHEARSAPGFSTKVL